MTGPAATNRRTDEGSVLAMTLVMTTVSGLLLVALLSYVSTVLRVRPPLEERAVAAETARSAVRQAVHQQRIAGPGACYQTSQTISINGYDVDVDCVVTDVEFDNVLMRNRLGVVTTMNRFDDGAGAPLAPIEVSVKDQYQPVITGDVFVNGGAIDDLLDGVEIIGTSSDGSQAGVVGSSATYAGAPTPVRYALPGPVPGDCAATETFFEATTGESWDCIAEPWTARAGNNADPTSQPWVYPFLPSVPTQTRSSTPISIPRGPGVCNVFYPGHYPNGIDIARGQAYFASGVYYFEGPITIREGAHVVGGEGVYSGCVLDSEAALYSGPTQRAPKVHGITGNGTTFLLGDDATLSVTRADLLLNRRLSTPTTRPTEGISIRSVNTVTTDTADVYVPEDQVYAQESAPTVPASATAYIDSEPPGGWNSPIVRFDTTVGGPVPSNSRTYEFRALGAIFTPNAAIEMTSATPHYVLEVTGGLTATRLVLDLKKSSHDEEFFLGVKATVIQSTQRFDALVTSASGRKTVSSTVMQLNVNREYALNSWTVDVGSGSGSDPTNGGAGIP